LENIKVETKKSREEGIETENGSQPIEEPAPPLIQKEYDTSTKGEPTPSKIPTCSVFIISFIIEEGSQEESEEESEI
jgi:hypothetical protein